MYRSMALWLRCVLLAVMTLPFAAGAADCEPWLGRLQSMQGTVDIQRFRGQSWQTARLGQTYCYGDRIRVGADARASVELSNETVLRLDQRSTLVFPEPSDDGFSFVELIEGALHLMSRVRGKLEIRTPFVNAGLEGTEFVVRVLPTETVVAVIEGRVALTNPHGSLSIDGGQTASATRDTAPVVRLDIKPDDAVHWALYYPTVVDPNAPGVDVDIVTAQRLLGVGQLDEAAAAIGRTLSRQPDNADALALGAVIALAQNGRLLALQLASDAVGRRETPATLSALSYAQQATFDLPAALATSQRGVALFPGEALQWSRLAELHAAMGARDQAVAAAKRAVELDPGLSRTRTVLGFADLGAQRTTEARSAFEQAIQLDSADPLPRLGLGLVEIRNGRLAEGRRQFEVAVSLDPANALIRSYLGKAYAHEDRGDKAATQFALARQLDPLDPTPWLYEGLHKQASNRPIEAIRDYEKSIALNDNRAVNRSRLLLDDDLAVRNANIGSAYAELGLRDVARTHATRSLAANPGNAAAHALLAESYEGVARRGITRMSERLQAQLLQPLSARPVTPGELIREQDPAAGQGRFATGANEYSALFEDNDPRLYSAGFIGDNATSGLEIVHSRMLDQVSYSVGYAKFDSDGYRSGVFDADGYPQRYGADFSTEVYNAFIQIAASDAVNLQFEARHQDKDQGDLKLDPRSLSDTERRDLESDLLRAGARWDASESTTLLLTLAHAERDETLYRPIAAIPCFFPFCAPPGRILTYRTTSDNREGILGELQLQQRANGLQLVAGASRREVTVDIDSRDSIIPPVLPAVPTQRSDDLESTSFYFYSHWEALDDLLLTLGLSYDDHDEPLAGTPVEYSRLNPKLGLQWQIVPWLAVRAAHVGTTKHQLIVEETIEPTQVAGFAQFYDDFNRSESDLNAVALDVTPMDGVFGLLEYLERDTSEVQTSNSLHEKSFRAELAAIINDRWTASVGFTRQEDDFRGTEVFELATNQVPISMFYSNPNGLFGQVNWTVFDQAFRPLGSPRIDTRFNAVSAALGYRWNRDRNRFVVGVDDALDDVDEYRDDRHKSNDRLNVYRPFVPGRSFWASIAIALD